MSTIDTFLNYTFVLISGVGLLWSTLKSGTKHRVLASFALLIILLSLTRLAFMYWGMSGIAQALNLAGVTMVVITAIGLMMVDNPRVGKSANGNKDQNKEESGQ